MKLFRTGKILRFFCKQNLIEKYLLTTRPKFSAQGHGKKLQKEILGQVKEIQILIFKIFKEKNAYS
jgi:hypothetical protein